MSDGKRILLTGSSGMGKSTLMNQLMRPSSHLIVFDYLPTRRATAGKEGLSEIDSLAKLKTAVSNNYKSGFRLWYRPPMGDQIDALHKLSRFLLRVQSPIEQGRDVPPLTLAIDEMRLAFPVQNLPTDQRGFYDISSAGRHYRINVIGATQRPAQINTEFRGNAGVRYFMGQTEAVDIKAVYDMTRSKAIANKVAAMPPYHYIRYAQGKEATGRTQP